MIEGVLVVAVALGVLVWVVAPLRTGAGQVAASPDPAEEATARKFAALGAIVDLEDEHTVGKLSDRDFVRLRAQYEQEALGALRELDARTSDHEDDLEAEIAAMKARLGAAGGMQTCPRCGASHASGRACPACGFEQ